jgi:hypothetical protein
MVAMHRSAPNSAALAQWLGEQQGALTSQIQQVLRATMFSNRQELRPSHFARIAAEEAQSLCAFGLQPELALATRRGEQLCKLGLGEESLLKLSQVARHCLIEHAPPELRLAILELAESYHTALVRGFMAARTALTLEEQERIRSAIQRTVSRYAIQMSVAAEVARAATSILDLDELLQTSSELIRERFNFYYVGVFLIDADHRWAYLQASAGEAGLVYRQWRGPHRP